MTAKLNLEILGKKTREIEFHEFFLSPLLLIYWEKTFFHKFLIYSYFFQVAAKLNLDVLTSHLVAVHAYIGVLEVVLAAASKKDPQGKITELLLPLIIRS